MRYKVLLTRAAERGLDALPKADLRRVRDKILALADDPHPPGSKKLRGEDELYRIRSGDYRILYQIDAGQLVVLVVDVGHRRDIYRP